MFDARLLIQRRLVFPGGGAYLDRVKKKEKWQWGDVFLDGVLCDDV